RELQKSENPEAERLELLKTWSFDSSPYKAAGKHLIDDIIDPRDTRKFLSQTLEFACAKNGSKSERRLANRSEEHTSELQSRFDLVCGLLLEKEKKERHRKHGLPCH